MKLCLRAEVAENVLYTSINSKKSLQCVGVLPSATKGKKSAGSDGGGGGGDAGDKRSLLAGSDALGFRRDDMEVREKSESERERGFFSSLRVAALKIIAPERERAQQQTKRRPMRLLCSPIFFLLFLPLSLSLSLKHLTRSSPPSVPTAPTPTGTPSRPSGTTP
jgi:hypothetical protein